MFRFLSVAALLLQGTSALAQRANENAVTSAGDAFGTSIGNERVGLYSITDVRGFSPIQAGNVRIEGLSVTEHGGFTSRVVSGSTIRVGLTAQSYPFPAPTGIADYTLRAAGDEPIVSILATFGPIRAHALEVDAQLPIVPDKLGFAGGFSYRFDEAFKGDNVDLASAGGVLRWRPTDQVEIKPFYGRTEAWNDRSMPLIFTGGAYLPPKVERRYIGADWTEGRLTREFFGGIGAADFGGGLSLKAGLFRWDEHQKLGRFEIYRRVQPDGSAERSLVASQDQRFGSTSGELRPSYTLLDGDRRHVFHLSLRGRSTRRQYGGADVIAFGPDNIGNPSRIEEVEPDYGDFSRDKVRQLTGGIGYEGRWLGVGELSLGLQKADYSKKTTLPEGLLVETSSKPWLYNGTLALYATDKLALYAGYTRGLEESGIAPQDALNRNEAPPAILTSQRDAGFRYALRPNLSFVAGLFDVRKPYFAVDRASIYRELGIVRHRGAEISLTGQLTEGLSLVAGAVLLDADVSGEAVELGVIGPKPVGTVGRTVRVNLDYRLPFDDAFSVDLGIVNIGERIASVRTFAELDGEQLKVPGRTVVDVGGRYRFRIGNAPATLRAQITNLFNVYSWEVGSNGSFRFSDHRRFILSLAADL